jgi:hypothetical protein
LLHGVTTGAGSIENTSSSIYFIVAFIQPLPSNGGLSSSYILASGKYVTKYFPHQYANILPIFGLVSNEFTKNSVSINLISDMKGYSGHSTVKCNLKPLD